MKNLCCLLGIIIISAVFSCKAIASQPATREECVEKTQAAAKMIEEQGLEKTLAMINDRKGPFVWKNSYVFCISSETGAMLGHPYFPSRMLGMNINEVTDINGKKYMLEIQRTAITQGQGWVDYEFRLKNKNTYVMQIPAANVVIGAGYYDGVTFPAPQFKASDEKVPDLQGKKAAVIIAPKGFEDNEFTVPMELFKRAGVATTVFSISKGVAKGMYGAQVDILNSLEQLKVEDFDAVVFVGGAGSAAMHNNPEAHAIAQLAAQQGKIVSAICWAPVILANSGVLDNRKVTVNPFEAEPFRKRGLDYTGKQVSIDGNIITANGPAASEAFARAILAAMK